MCMTNVFFRPGCAQSTVMILVTLEKSWSGLWFDRLLSRVDDPLPGYCCTSSRAWKGPSWENVAHTSDVLVDLVSKRAAVDELSGNRPNDWAYLMRVSSRWKKVNRLAIGRIELCHYFCSFLSHIVCSRKKKTRRNYNSQRQTGQKNSKKQEQFLQAVACEL